MNSIWGKDDQELIFVVFDGYEGGYTALEGNVGLMAMANDEQSLNEAIMQAINAHFKGAFEGILRIRRFTDTIVTIAPSVG